MPDKRYDICIIGAGAIGLAIANEFVGDQTKQVLLVDSGGLDSSGDPPAWMTSVVNTGNCDSGVAGSRYSGFGGSTSHWGGQALPFEPIDFQARPWLGQEASTRWPVSPSTLARFYPRVHALFGVDSSDFSADIWCEHEHEHEHGNSWQGLAEAHGLKLAYSKYSPQPDFAKSIGKAVLAADNIQLMSHSHVLQFNHHAERPRIQSVTVSTDTGRKDLFADQFILAGGGIENARCLLNSNKRTGLLLGDEEGLLGACYQDHLGLYGARLEPIDWRSFRALFAPKLAGRQRNVPKLFLREQVQAEHRTANIVGNLEAQLPDSSATQRIKNTYRAVRRQGFGAATLREILSLFASSKELSQVAISALIRNEVFIPESARCFLVANIETVASRDSKISLTDEQDEFGLHTAALHWQVGQESKLAAQQYYVRIKDFLESAKVANVVLKPEVFADSDDWLEHCYGLYHPMGATRMSENKGEGVVNTDCRVFGTDNLFISGTSVLPSGSASNPTFTALALSLRLADALCAN